MGSTADGRFDAFARWRDAAGRLRAGTHTLLELAEETGGPFYAVSLAAVRARMAALRAALPAGMAILYAVKANPLAGLVSALLPLTDGLDIASGGELLTALAAGADGTRLSFAGPGKTDAELAQAAACGATVVLESVAEAQRLARIAPRARVLLRVNPPFELDAAARMGGGPRKFGVDAEIAAPALREVAELGLDLAGIHVYAGSQCLDAAAILSTQRATLALARSLCAEAGLRLDLLNLGGGLGVPYFPEDTPLDLATLGTGLTALAGEAVDTRLVLELGRYIVAEAGLYVCRIVERKVSRGRTFLITDGGLNHHWHATGALEGRRHLHFPLTVAQRVPDAATEPVCVAGPLCAPHDVFAAEVTLPRAAVGDLIVVAQSGAYGAAASPAGFLGRAPAAQLLV